MGLLDLFSTPEGRAQLYDLLFNFDGRISRAGYWRACFAWLILLLLLLFVMIVLGSLMPYLAVAVTLIAWLLLLNSQIAVSKKRLHDRDKSGWWLLLFFLGPVILGAVAMLGDTIARVCEIAALVISVWMIVELGCRPAPPVRTAMGLIPSDRCQPSLRSAKFTRRPVAAPVVSGLPDADRSCVLQTDAIRLTLRASPAIGKQSKENA